MFDENNAEPQANVDADNTAEKMDAEAETDLDEGLDQEDADSLRIRVRTEHEQKKHWRDKAKKFEDELRQKQEEAKPAPKPKVKASEIDPEVIESRITDQIMTRQRYPDMTAEEFSRAKQLAAAEGVLVSEIVEDNYFQAYMKLNREKMAKDKARPNPSNRSGNPSNFSIADLADPVKVANMDPETFEKLSNQAGSRSRYN